MIKDVERFMNAAGHTTAVTNPMQATLYANLVEEEHKELQEALAANNDVEVLDAIFDSIWVLIGLALRRGDDIIGAWAEGARSNLAKISPNGFVIRNDAGKVQKPPGWVKPDFRSYVGGI